MRMMTKISMIKSDSYEILDLGVHILLSLND